MKQVIFVCLLALSVCFSQAATSVETAAQTAPLLQQNAPATETKTNETKLEQTPVAGASSADATKPATEIAGKPETQNATTSATQTAKASNETTTKPNETKTASSEKTNHSTETKTAVTTPKPLEPSHEKNETKATTPANPPPANGTSADGKDGKKTETTTPKGENVSPAVAPVEAKTRAFDGPSFIGGIILTLGLLAIGFMGFKYYKNQTERNYHTL